MSTEPDEGTLDHKLVDLVPIFSNDLTEKQPVIHIVPSCDR